MGKTTRVMICAMGLCVWMGASARAPVEKPGPARSDSEVSGAEKKLGRGSVERRIPGGVGVWTQSGGRPARSQDQTEAERAAVAMETAEQLLVAVEFYKMSSGGWPDSLKQATDKARLSALPIIVGLGPWELGPAGSIQAAVEEEALCSELRDEGHARSSAGVGSPAGCSADPEGGRMIFVMTQMNQS